MSRHVLHRSECQRTAGPAADPVTLASDVVGQLIADTGLRPDGVQLVVLACVNPGEWPSAPRSALLDGEFAADVVRRVVVHHGLLGAVPFGVSLDADNIVDLARECAIDLMMTETLDTALAVAVFSRPTGALTELVATACELHLGPGRQAS